MVLAHLYEDSNALDKAEEQYQIALTERPDYPFALAGLGKIARYKKDYPKAIEYFEKAKTVMADASFFEELIDLYRLNGQNDKADECARITIDALLSDNIAAAKDKSLGHYSDMELAQLYLKTNQLDKALQHAKSEQQRRPENIDACETLATVLFKMGKAAEAAPLIETALRTNSQKPERLVLAGQVKIALGQMAEGDVLVAKGMALKPYMEM
ncbi:MAG: tetratricopeptide repeat protein [Lewinellaceae bacterium]|nr:tetratricopeptide repeat protein [Lewinellaceae bacterium]